MAELINVYGGTGSFKTAQVVFLAKYMYERFGKTTRLISCDGGGWQPVEDDGLIANGIVEAWAVSSIEQPRSVLRKLSQGYWPERVTGQNGQVRLVLRAPSAETWEKVGCIAVEGLTSIANIIMRDALNKQLKVAGDESQAQFSEKLQIEGLDGKELTQEEKYSFAARGNYNDAQRAVYDIITNFRSLPVKYVYVTALEARGEEEDTGKTILGPAVIGKAVTSQVGSWVGAQIHADDYFVETPDPTHILTEAEKKAGVKQRSKQETKARYWFIRHPDTRTGMPFPAKPRVAPSSIPALLKRYPGGYFEPTPQAGLDAFLVACEELATEASDATSKWKIEVDRKRELDKPKPKVAAAVEAGMTGSVK